VATTVLDVLVKEVIADIRSVCSGYSRVFVMFSGGRDSLVVLDLTLRSLGTDNVEALFIDTRIATPGLKSYVMKRCKEYGVKLNIICPNQDFFELVLKKGFPMIKYRWCKEYLKMKPLKHFVENVKKLYGDIILLTGVRRDESWFKARAEKIYDHPQLGVKVYAPIFEWSSELVKEYIRIYRLKENPLYKIYGKAYDCWCTVYKSPADFALLAIHHPKFFRKFVEVESKLRSGGSALYYDGEKVYLRDIAERPLDYLRKYSRTFKCPLCRMLL